MRFLFHIARGKIRSEKLDKKKGKFRDVIMYSILGAP